MLSGPNGPVFADRLGKPDLITHLGRSTGTPDGSSNMRALELRR